MGRVLREQLRNLVAIAVLAVLGSLTAYVIVQEQRLRIPILEEKPFELKAEFQTVQAVVPGQGQTVRVAGVRVGDVDKVELVDGRGVVTFAIDREFIPIYRDATMLMRPTTGLKDMFFELDPGTRQAGAYDEHEMIPMANTAPDVNLDEILAALDADTQSYLRLLLVGGGEALKNRDKELGRLLGSLGPINRDLAVLNKKVAERSQEFARLIHNLNVLTTTVGRSETELTRLVAASASSLGAIAQEDPDVSRLVELLPGTLEEGRQALESMERFATILGPAFNDLRPFARNLDELNDSTRDLAVAATPVLKNEIRPFVRVAKARMPDLGKAASRFSDATPRLTTVVEKINRLANMAAKNPNGAQPAGAPGRDEGYLYWVSWLGHHSSSVFSAGDGNGFYRRIYLTMGCEHAAALTADPDPVVEQFRKLVSGFTDAVVDQVCN